MFGLDGSITHWSAGASTLFGWQAHEVIGRNLTVLFPNQTLVELRKEFQSVRFGEEFRGEKFSRKADGTEFWVDVHATLMIDTNSVPTGLLSVMQDATERRRLAAEVRRRTEMEHQLIAMVSHDLRNPLSAIELSAGLALGSTDDPKLRRYLERIKLSSDRAIRLIHDLLDFNSMQHGGRLPVQRRSLDLGQVVQEQVDEVLVSRPERTVEVQVTGDVTGSWDPDRLSQVVGNLVSNALAHTTEDVSVKVVVAGHAQHVELQVIDTGGGISADGLESLFQPFVRGTTSGASGRSVGLGLFITRAIVEAHGGRITCHSEVGEGTTFTVVLPREGQDP